MSHPYEREKEREGHRCLSCAPILYAKWLRSKEKENEQQSQQMIGVNELKAVCVCVRKRKSYSENEMGRRKSTDNIVCAKRIRSNKNSKSTKMERKVTLENINRIYSVRSNAWNRFYWPLFNCKRSSSSFNLITYLLGETIRCQLL